MKLKIIEVIYWQEDTVLMDGDASHEGYRAIQQLLEQERVEKIDEGKAKGLPFICEADSIDEAVELYNNKYYELDYLKAGEVDWEEIVDDELE